MFDFDAAQKLAQSIRAQRPDLWTEIFQNVGDTGRQVWVLPPDEHGPYLTIQQEKGGAALVVHTCHNEEGEPRDHTIDTYCTIDSDDEDALLTQIDEVFVPAQ